MGSETSNNAHVILTEKCNELRELSEQLLEKAIEDIQTIVETHCSKLHAEDTAAIQDMRQTVDNRCSELQSFAEGLRNALLEEVRCIIVPASLPRAPSPARAGGYEASVEEHQPSCGGGARGVRALRIHGKPGKPAATPRLVAKSMIQITA